MTALGLPERTRINQDESIRDETSADMCDHKRCSDCSERLCRGSAMTRSLFGLWCKGTSAEVEALPLDEPAELRVLLLRDPPCHRSAPSVRVEVSVAASIEVGQIGVM